MSLLNKNNLNITELSELDSNNIDNLTLDFKKQRALKIQKLLKDCKTATLIDDSDCYLIIKFVNDDIYHFSICNMEYKYVMNFGYIKFEDLNKLIQNRLYIYAYIDDKPYNLKL